MIFDVLFEMLTTIIYINITYKDQKKILEVWLKIVPGVANSVPEL